MNAKRIIKRCGGSAEVARVFGISRQAVHQWIEKKKIPPERLSWLKVERPEVFRES